MLVAQNRDQIVAAFKNVASKEVKSAYHRYNAKQLRPLAQNCDQYANASK